MKDHRHDHVEFVYNKETIFARIDTYFSEHIHEHKHYLHFEYKGARVNISYGDNASGYYSVGQGICKLIDAIGAEKYTEFSNKKDEIGEIQRNRIIIDSKVYGNHYEDVVSSGSLRIYLMGMEMSDGNSIDGNSRSKFFYEDDRRSKSKSFENLKSKVIEYHKDNGVLPSDKYLNLELTTKYSELEKWMNDNIPNYKH